MILLVFFNTIWTVLRPILLRGFYIISYVLGIYVLNLLIGFMSPEVDPELEALDEASLPTRVFDESRPFLIHEGFLVVEADLYGTTLLHYAQETLGGLLIVPPRSRRSHPLVQDFEGP
ncbi:Retrieval of early ER protein Rer1, partial [Dillenia turbinata]